MPQYDIWRQPYSKEQISAAVNNIVPVIDPITKTWKVWDIANMVWVDTGISAYANPIVSVTKTSTSGLVDTYTIAFEDGTTQQFQVTNGQNGTNGTDGDDGISPTVSIIAITGGHRITITDAEHPTGQSFDIMDGTGSGDMQSSNYDPNGVVLNAGGIQNYVSDNAQSKDITSNRGPLPTDAGTPGQRWLDTAHGNVEYTCVGVTVGTPNTYTWLYTGGCNDNLLDNWYFVGGGSQQGGGQFPINGRGQTSYTGAGYWIDRWALQQLTDSSIVLHDGYVSLYAKSNDGICQRIELAQLYVGREYTISCLTAEGVMFSKTFKLTEDIIVYDYNETWKCAAGILNGGWVIYLAITYNNATAQQIDIVAAKLELGSTQTLAHQDENGNWVLNEMPDFQQELAKCYRYQMVYPGVEWGRFAIANAWKGGATVLLWLPSPMRASPSINVSELRFHDGINAIDVNSPNISDLRMHGNVLAFDVYTTRFTNGKFYTVSTRDGAPLIIDANL